MTYLQSITIEQMMRQGLHNQLRKAMICWQKHKKYVLEETICVPSTLYDLIRRTNTEADINKT